MVRKIPVTICRTTLKPNKEPKFHQVDKLIGVGSVITALLTILRSGLVFRNGLDI